MSTMSYRHWRDVPENAWRWPNFSPAEIACRGSGTLLVNEPALDKLQALRDRLGKPLIVRSAYRSLEHNRAVGGATRSGLPRLRLLPALGVHPCRSRPRAAVGRAVPSPGDGLRRGNATSARGACTKPDHERRRGGQSGDAGRGRGRGRAERPRGNSVSRPAASAVPRHTPLGVHRRGSVGH